MTMPAADTKKTAWVLIDNGVSITFDAPAALIEAASVPRGSSVPKGGSQPVAAA